VERKTILEVSSETAIYQFVEIGMVFGELFESVPRYF
jgi:hypothetical protein